MTIFIYDSLNSYSRDISDPVKVIANIPFIFNRDEASVKVFFPDGVEIIKYYTYELKNNCLYLWRNY